MKILNLFAGIGGNRSLWGDNHEVTAVENKQQIAYIYHERFPNDKTIIGDAYKYLENHYKEFDFVWASPPCQTHTRMVAFPRFIKKLPDLRLYSLIIFLERFFKGYYVENVISYYKPLIPPAALIDRHYIWCNFPIEDKKFEKPRGNIKDLKKEQLCDFLQVPLEIIMKLNVKQWRNHDPKGSVLRNCVLPEAGKYILDALIHSKIDQKTIQNYL